MRNILFICHTSGSAGGEKVMVESVKILSHDYNIFVVAPNDGNNGLDRLLEGTDIRGLIKINYRVGRSSTLLFLRNVLYGLFFGLIPLIHYILKKKIDLIYVNSSVNIIGILAAVLTRRKFIIHIHEQSNKYHKWIPEWTRNFYRVVFKSRRCGLIFVSQYSLHQWEHFLKSNININVEIIHPPYTPPLEYPEESDYKSLNFNFGLLGSLSHNKNAISAVNCMEYFPDNKLIIGGTGEEIDTIKKISENNPNIILLGNVIDVDSFYRNINCLIVPSFNESWGLVVLEAISRKIPVILTVESGLLDILVDKEDVLFINPNDMLSIKNAMNVILSDQEMRQHLVLNSTRKLDGLNLNYQYKKKILDFVKHFMDCK